MPSKKSVAASAAEGHTGAATRSISAEHKVALAQGRQEGRLVRSYLESLERRAPRRGRRRTTDSIDRRLAAIEDEFPGADPLRRLKLMQERRDLTEERDRLETPLDFDALEDAFVEVAAAYSQRQGISYDSWREIGVPTAVLARAGISRIR